MTPQMGCRLIGCLGIELAPFAVSNYVTHISPAFDRFAAAPADCVFGTRCSASTLEECHPTRAVRCGVKYATGVSGLLRLPVERCATGSASAGVARRLGSCFHSLSRPQDAGLGLGHWQSQWHTSASGVRP